MFNLVLEAGDAYAMRAEASGRLPIKLRGRTFYVWHKVLPCLRDSVTTISDIRGTREHQGTLPDGFVPIVHDPSPPTVISTSSELAEPMQLTQVNEWNQVMSSAGGERQL